MNKSITEIKEIITNYENMIKMISKIIKYSFCCSVSSSLGYLNTPIKIDEDYKRYLYQ